MANDELKTGEGPSDSESLEGATIAAREAKLPFVLALDVGTSSVRAALYDSACREVGGTAARIERGFRTTPGGGAEMDAEEAIADVLRVIDEVLVRAPAAGIEPRIEAVAVACFWHSLVGLDRDGQPVTPVFGWADTRAAADALALREQLDESAAHGRTGCRFHPSYWPAKLLWLQKERAEVWRAATRWMSFAELLALRLCGESKASVSMASGTGLFDLRSCDWDAPLLRELKLDANQLPLIAGDGETLTLAARYGERWPQLRRGCAFFPAVGDGAANNIGEGCASRSRAALMIGTSAAMRVVYEGAAPSELDESLWCYRVDRKRVVVGGALSDGGGLYAWLTDALALSSRAATGEHERTTDSAEIERALDVSGPDSHGLTMLPFWAGERSTGWHTSARGAILGLTMHTRPIEILRACMESIAYRCAVIADALEAHAPGMSLRASGGALRASPAWARILADALGRPLALSRVREASSRGAVLLALEAMGAIKSVTEFPVEAGEVFEPDEARHALYRKGLERQQRIYELLVNDSEVARLLSEAGE